MTEEKFSSPGNRLLGAIGIALGAAAVLAMAVDGPGRSELVAIFAISFVAALFWAFLVRPQIRLTPTTLTLRNPLVSHRIPLQLVKAVEVRRYTIVSLTDSELTSTAMSRGIREIARHDRGGPASRDQAGFMTGRIHARVDESRHKPVEGEVAVRRTPAWVEIALLAGSALGLAVTLLL